MLDATPFIERYRRRWSIFMQWLTELVPTPLINIGEQILQKVAEIREAIAASPATLTHGDFRPDNVLFGALDAPLLLLTGNLSGERQLQWISPTS